MYNKTLVKCESCGLSMHRILRSQVQFSFLSNERDRRCQNVEHWQFHEVVGDTEKNSAFLVKVKFDFFLL